MLTTLQVIKHTHTHTHTHTENSYKYYSFPNVQNTVHGPGTHYGDTDEYMAMLLGDPALSCLNLAVPSQNTVASPIEWGEHYERPYSRITSTKSPSFSKITFSATLIYLVVLLPKWHDCGYQVTEEYWHLHHSDRRNTLMYAHMTLRALSTCDIS